MHEARFRPHDLGQMGEEGDDVMLDLALDLVDPRHVEFRVPALFPEFGGGLLGHHAQFGQGVGGVRLDLEPDAEFGLGRPDRNHLFAGIAGDHGNFRLLREAFRPSGPPREAVVAPGFAADAVMDGEEARRGRIWL